MEQLSDTRRIGEDSAAEAERQPRRSRARSTQEAGERARRPASAVRERRTSPGDSIRQIVLPLAVTLPTLALVAIIATRIPPGRTPVPGVTSAVRSIYRTSAVQLYRDYDSDETATQARIGQQRVLVTGTVTAVSQDYLGNNRVLLDVGNSVSAAEMALRSDQNLTALQLQRGQKVALLCDQMQRLTDAPEGGGCVLVNPLNSYGPLSSYSAAAQRVATR